MTYPEPNQDRVTEGEKMRRWTGRSAFLLPVLLVLLLFVSAYWGISREINRIAREQQSRELTLAKTTIDDRLFSSARALENHESEIREALAHPRRGGIESVLEEMSKIEVGIDHVAIFSKEGIDLFHYPEDTESPGIDYSNTHWYRDYVSRGGRSSISDAIGGRSVTPLAVIVFPVKDVPGYKGISAYAAIRLTSITGWLSPFRIGENGGLVLLDRHDRVVASSATLNLTTGSKFTNKCNDCLTGERRTFDDWRLVAILPRSEIRSSILTSLFIPLLAGLSLIAISGLIGLRIRSLNELSARQQVAVEEARDQIEANFRELESGLLPVLPAIPGWQISLSHTSATYGTRIGGDFFDVFTSKSGDLVTIIGDVSGKGLTASAVATGARTATRAFFETTDDPKEVLTALNRYMTNQTPKNIFITMLICIFGESNIKIVTAGHPLPIWSRGGVVEEPGLPAEIVGLPLAIFPDASYETYELETAVDDRLTAIFYTDGLIEARGNDGLFGVERVSELFAQFLEEGMNAEAITGRMRQEATEWSLGELKDDLAIICAARSS